MSLRRATDAGRRARRRVRRLAGPCDRRLVGHRSGDRAPLRRARCERVVSLDLNAPDDGEAIAWQHCDVAEDASVRNAVEAAIGGSRRSRRAGQ